MDGLHVDQLTRSLSESRRALVGGALFAVVGWLGVAGAEAKKKRKRKHKKRKPKKATPNEFGCLDVGDPCTSEDDCCSGICAGDMGKQRCQGHDTGGCRAGYTPDICVDEGAQDVPCATSSGITGLCFTTTGKAGYCGAPQSAICRDCARDEECATLLGSGAACVLCDGDCGSPACVGAPGF